MMINHKELRHHSMDFVDSNDIESAFNQSAGNSTVIVFNSNLVKRVREVLNIEPYVYLITVGAIVIYFTFRPTSGKH